MNPTPRIQRGRRRSLRVELAVPLRVVWQGRDGARREERTATVVVNAHGCLLTLRAPLLVGAPLEITHGETGAVRRGRVVWCGEVAPDGRTRVGVELADSAPEFWGSGYAEAFYAATTAELWVG